jgi:lactoylglutathione lyase
VSHDWSAVLLPLLHPQLLRTRDNPEYKYTLAFLGYGPEEDNCVLELTYNYGKTEYTKGNGYAQVGARYWRAGSALQAQTPAMAHCIQPS